MFVRKVIPQSTVDGPGNRTAIFLQGCNIRCAYCQNPETQQCVDVSSKVNVQSSSNALRYMVSPADILKQVAANIPFIRGITVSGGECMLQADEMTELFRFVKDLSSPVPLTCLIDSNGTIPFARYPRLMKYTDGVMLDVKAWDDDVYQTLTGAKNTQQVKENIVYLVSISKLTEIRITCLPEESPIKTDVETILHELSLIEPILQQHIPIILQRFRPQGVEGQLSTLSSTSDSEMHSYLTLAQELMLNAKIR